MAQRIFPKQLKTLVETYYETIDSIMSLDDVLIYHQIRYPYQINPQSLGFNDMRTEFKLLFATKYMEVLDDRSTRTMNHAVEVIISDLKAFPSVKLISIQFTHRCKMLKKLDTFQ